MFIKKVQVFLFALVMSINFLAMEKKGASCLEYKTVPLLAHVNNIVESVSGRCCQEHPISEFVGGLVQSARKKGNLGTIAFLKEAQKWGIGVDSVF